VQMTLAVEFVHANQLVHGRLSSHSFYVCDGGASLRLLVGNTAAEYGDAGTAPPNVRWLPRDDAFAQRAPTTATDVYSVGILLWELYSAHLGCGVPHSAAIPADDAFLMAIREQQVLPPLTMNSLAAPELILQVFDVCTHADARKRPWMHSVASVLLDADPARWEKDPSDMEHVQNLGAGQFGQVVKMSTRLFSKSGEKEFVAAKMLTAGAASAADTLQADFMKEVEVMKQFRHPHLVRLLGICTANKPFMIILEYLPGGSLDQWLPANGPNLLKPTPFKLIRILHQVALGMGALGSAGVVHPTPPHLTPLAPRAQEPFAARRPDASAAGDASRSSRFAKPTRRRARHARGWYAGGGEAAGRRAPGAVGPRLHP